jgi:hypothetical protein
MLKAKELPLLNKHIIAVEHLISKVQRQSGHRIKIIERDSVTIDFDWVTLIYEQSILF